MKKIIPITGLILSMSITCASAQVAITESKLDVNTGILTVTGTTDEPNTGVSLNIPKMNVSPEDLQASGTAGELLFYSGQKVSGQDGEFTFTVDFAGSEEGKYEIYVGSEADDTAAQTATSYISATGYETLIGALNSAALVSETQFNDVFDQNEEKVFLYTDIETENRVAAKKILYNYAKSEKFSPTDSVTNMKVYKAALAAQLLGEERTGDAVAILDEMYVVPNGVTAKYNAAADFAAYIDTDEKKAYYASIFNDCTTLQEFDKEFVDAMLLTVVRHPGNVTTLKEIFTKYAAYTGAKTGSASLLSYSAISGSTYSDISACVAAFNRTINDNTSGGSSGGSSSSGFGVVAAGTPVTNNEKIDIKFEDLNSVPWAYNAISELYDKNIISGRSETRFSPNDRVTREEFATMLVKMAGVGVESGAASFKDVDSNAWYNGYVNTAYKYGFCNGTGNGAFGIGMEIIRQDMCVMAYNTLKALGYNVPDGALAFGDSDAIAEYAKAPVAALSGAGVVNGVGNNAFNPTGSATRAEAAVIIYKVLTYIG